jgi:hypothetical protein
MSTLMLTDHAAVRMVQRGIRINDCELIALVATPVDDGYFVRDQDCQWLEKYLKCVLERLRRIRGKRLVVTNGRIVTASRLLGGDTKIII